MANSARSLYQAELMRKWYPAFSRRATQVCILSSAMEKIAGGATDPRAIAHTALAEADAFGWKERALHIAGAAGPLGDPDIVGVMGHAQNV